MAISFDFTGNINWSQVIKKDNSYRTPRFSSFYSTISNNEQLLILFNDDSRNHMSAGMRYNSFDEDMSEAIVLYELNLANGEIGKKLLANHMLANGFRIIPSLCGEMSNSELLLFSSRPNNIKHQKFMTLKIKE